MARKPEKWPLTPDELRWRAAARDPEKAKRNLKLQYVLLGCWGVLILVWIAALCFDPELFDWTFIVVLILSLASIIPGIVNNKRILAGKKPWGDI